MDSMDADLDLETRFNAVYACNKMATRNSNHEIMVSGGIPQTSRRSMWRGRSTRAVPGLCLLKAPCRPMRSRRQIVLEGALVPLATAALVRKDLETQREVATYLLVIALADDNRSDII